MTNYATSLESLSQERDHRPTADEAAETKTNAHAATRDGLLVEDVTKEWGKRSVLSGIELELEPGTAAWIGGRNGVGKTTLLRIVAGLIAADRGEVALGALDPRRDRRLYHRSVGFLSAGDRGLYARLTTRQNLELWARLALLSRSECETAVHDAVARFALAELAEARTDRLSLGQRQRVRLALAFLHSPRLVLLDEPANSLDDQGLALVVGAIADLNRRGGMAIWCSPNRPDLDEIPVGYVLRDGRLLEDR
jgi:ABC-type multidrug transport system ATPase subunit